METWSYATIRCSLDGTIKSCEKRSCDSDSESDSEPLILCTIAGKSIYDLLYLNKDELYSFSRKHIHILTHQNNILRLENVHMNYEFSKHTRLYDCIMKIDKDTFIMYVNRSRS